MSRLARASSRPMKRPRLSEERQCERAASVTITPRSASRFANQEVDGATLSWVAAAPAANRNGQAHRRFGVAFMESAVVDGTRSPILIDEAVHPSVGLRAIFASVAGHVFGGFDRHRSHRSKVSLAGSAQDEPEDRSPVRSASQGRAALRFWLIG